MNLQNLHELNDDQLIIRFLDCLGLIHSIGKIEHNNLIYSFPLNLLSYYKKHEDQTKRDKNEGSVKIDIGTRVPATSETCNDALVSCWTAVSSDFNALELIVNNKFKKQNEPVYIVSSTIGKVKQQLEIILDFFGQIKFNGYSGHLSNAVYGNIQYYPDEGLKLSSWQQRTDLQAGANKQVIENMFHKHQNYADENEIRFAIILSNATTFCSKDSNWSLQTKTQHKGLIYPLLESRSFIHYIDDVFCIAGTLPKEVQPALYKCNLTPKEYESETIDI